MDLVYYCIVLSANKSSFITDLDPSTIEVLILTVSRTQAPAMKDLLYKHLARQSSIGVTIPVSPGGFIISGP